jgi:hypothetical protein
VDIILTLIHEDHLQYKKCGVVEIEDFFGKITLCSTITATYLIFYNRHNTRQFFEKLGAVFVRINFCMHCTSRCAYQKFYRILENNTFKFSISKVMLMRSMKFVPFYE